MEELEEKKEIVTEKKKGFIRRFFKFIFYTILTFIVLNVLLYALLSIPYVQQRLLNFAVGQLSSKLNTEVSIDEIRLRLFNHAVLKGIYVEDQKQDTLLYAQHLDVSLSPWELIRSRKLVITGIELEDFLINVNQKDSVSDFNFQFVIDAFASGDTTKVDTTKSSLEIVIKDIDIKKGRLNYDVLSAPRTPHIFNASHISLSDFEANIDLNSIDPDRLDIALNHLSAKEQSGLEIRKLEARAYSEKSQYWVDGLSLTLPNSHLNAERLRYNLSTGQFEFSTTDSEFSPQDLSVFLPGLKFLLHPISLKTDIKGTLPQVSVDNFSLAYGEECVLEASASLGSYEKYDTSDLNVFIHRFRVSPKAINAFARVGDSTFVAPPMLNNMGDIFLKGELGGQLSKFRLNMEAWCRQGAVNLGATGAIDSTFTNFNVTSTIRTQNLNLGNILGQDTGLGRLAMNISVRARQSNPQNLSAQVQGSINSLQYKEQTLRNIPFSAFYNVVSMGLAAKADLPIGKLMAEAEMTQAKVPDVTLLLRLDSLHVDRFYKNEAWENPRLSFNLEGKIKGLDIDNLVGKIKLDSIDFHDDNFNFQPAPIVFEVGRLYDDEKFIGFTSEFLSAQVTGKYKFVALADEMNNLLHDYLPNVFLTKRYVKKQQNNFTFSICVANTERLGEIFDLPVDIVTPINISGLINTMDRKVSLKGNIPYLKLNDLEIKNTTIRMLNIDSAFSVQLGSNVLKDKGIYKLSFKMDGADNALHSLFRVKSDSTEVNIEGQLESLAEFKRDSENQLVSLLNIKPSDIKVKDFTLNLLPAKIINQGERTEIHNLGFGLNNKKYFGIDGVVSKQKSDTLRAYFDNAHINNILEIFGVDYVDAAINGNILLTNILQQPELYTKDFAISDIIVYRDTVGTINLNSEWSEELGGVRLNADLTKKDTTYAQIGGLIYTNKDSLDLKIHLDRLPLYWIKPFVGDMLSQLSGSISTKLTVQGSIAKPLTRGFLGFNDTSIGIDYTNVVYTISDTIQVSPDRIGFDDLTLRDSRGNTAKIKATVTHNNFADMKYSLDMEMKNLMLLNTEHRIDSLFYGQLFASGNIKIDGDDKGINMNMRIKNERNSSLNVLIPQTSQAGEYRSVVFINVPEDKLDPNTAGNSPRLRKDAVPMKMNVRLEVTPDIGFGVIINPQTGDAMQVRGRGIINFSYDTETENMQLFGDYTLTEGNVRLNLKGISTLEFRIKEGSKLNFLGDPLRTTFDITAFRRVRADLRTLDNSFADDGVRRVIVDCVLKISGNMNKMNLAYDIVLPDASEHIQQKVNGIINTEEQKIRQFAYLIASGTFYSNTSNSGASFSDGMWTNIASSGLSSGLNSVLGNALGDKWEIGTHIDSNDGTFSDVDMTVNVSTKLFDDRLKLNTNLGYRSDQTDNANTFIGDFDIEYQLSALWTLKVYNQTNDAFYRQAPYTQGVGIVYTKEGRTLKYLFQSFKPRWRSRSVAPIATDSLKTDTLKMNSPKQTVIGDSIK